LAEHIVVGGLGATPVGTPEMVADEMERWVREADVDGFNIAYAILPQTFTDVIELLLPELRKRGIFWDDYAVDGGSYRENLYEVKGRSHPPLDHPATAVAWDPPVNEGKGLKGVNGVNGYANGINGFAEEAEEVLDPIKMQFG